MERTRNRHTHHPATVANLKRLRTVKGRLATVNLVPGQRVVDEELYPGTPELREWKPHTSKLAAAIRKGLELSLPDAPTILYLGAASGTTVSYLSDLFPQGRIYAVEFSRDPMIDLVLLARTRPNIIPILADARHPDVYAPYLPPADLVFQDIAQRDQVSIFLDNCLLARAKAPLLIALKTRSIDVAAPVAKVAKAARAQLSERVRIEQELRLDPYEKDHLFYACRWP
jgi:fibrillarin-like pre-rRNA processing protein